MVNKSVEEEYQVVKRGREYNCCGEEYNVENREKSVVEEYQLLKRGKEYQGCGEEYGREKT